MKSFFFTFPILVLVAALGVGGYFAITSMTDPSVYITANNQVIGDMHSVITDPDTSTTNGSVVTTVAAAAASTTATSEAPSTRGRFPPNTEIDPSVASVGQGGVSNTTTTTLSSEITTMISNKISLKQGDKNANVGYIEQFMNLYFKKNSAIDNTFGASLKTSVMTFQKQNKISQTGTVTTTTLQMVQLWLKNNPQ